MHGLHAATSKVVNSAQDDCKLKFVHAIPSSPVREVERERERERGRYRDLKRERVRERKRARHKEGERGGERERDVKNGY